MVSPNLNELCCGTLLDTHPIGTALLFLKDSHSSAQSLWIFPRSAFQVLSCSLFASSNRACRASLLTTLARKRINHTINPTIRVTATTPKTSTIENVPFNETRDVWQFNRVIQIVARRKSDGEAINFWYSFPARFTFILKGSNPTWMSLLRISTKMWIMLWINVSPARDKQTRSDLEQIA